MDKGICLCWYVVCDDREFVSLKEVLVIVVFLHLPPVVDLVDFFVLVVFELVVFAGDGAHEEELLELLLGLRQGLVVQSQVPKQLVHLPVLVELAEGLGDEVHRQLGDQGDFALLLVLQFRLHVQLLLEQTAHHLLLHLQLLLVLLRVLRELRSDLCVQSCLRPLAFWSSSQIRCLQSMRVNTGLLARYSISFLNSPYCFFICFFEKQSMRLKPYAPLKLSPAPTSPLIAWRTLTIIITINYQQQSIPQMEEEASQSGPLIQSIKLNFKRFFFTFVVILVTSGMVYHTNVNTLAHARNFTRAMHYHVLNHQVLNIYWAGQELVNYPIHQYFQLPHFQDFLLNMHTQMSHLEDISYGVFDQTQVNDTLQEIIVNYRNGTVKSYDWTLKDGPLPGQPFAFNNSQQIKSTLIQSHAVTVKLQPIDLGNDNIWRIQFRVEPFSDTSMIVTLLMNQEVSLAKLHIAPFVLGVLLAIWLLRQKLKGDKPMVQNFLQYFLCVFLVVVSALSFSGQFKFQVIFMLDGVMCCSAWLCGIRFYTKEEDYKLSFLLNRSYGMIGRLFASFGPLLIAFSIFGYCVFSRYSGQFSSLWRTFTSLFYICYYNMFYESAVVTSRSNPISMVFFISFVLLFTMCIYSSMLVSVFCSYVWSKRENQIKKDIVNNLKIQCSSCDHKYKYADRTKVKPKTSFNLSQFLMVDWTDLDQRTKYKRVMSARINRLRTQAQAFLEENSTLIKENNALLPQEAINAIIEDCWMKKKTIQNLIGPN